MDRCRYRYSRHNSRQYIGRNYLNDSYHSKIVFKSRDRHTFRNERSKNFHTRRSHNSYRRRDRFYNSKHNNRRYVDSRRGESTSGSRRYYYNDKYKNKHRYNRSNQRYSN